MVWVGSVGLFSDEHGIKRKFAMKYRILLISVLTYMFFCGASVMHAQARAKTLKPVAPVLPLDIRFRFSPRYFQQSFNGDPHYARIEALVDEGHCDVVLLDKATNRDVFYSSLNRKVDDLTAEDADAHTTPIYLVASSTVDSDPLFRIHFHDQLGQEITWQFVVGEMVAHASPEVISHTDNSGIKILYAPRRAAGVAGTALTIGGRTYLPESTQSNGVLATFFATDMTIGQILRRTEFWSVEGKPADIAKAAKWYLSSSSGRQRVLAVRELSDTEAEVDQIELNDPDAPQVALNLVRVNENYKLHSLSFKTHGNTLWIFFGPALPFPAHQINDNTIAVFTVAENEQATVASGDLEVGRVVDGEHLLWRFDTPNSTKGASFETGVNLILAGREQANCANEDCTVH